jgi:signal transduction histidine kinase
VTPLVGKNESRGHRPGRARRDAASAELEAERANCATGSCSRRKLAALGQFVAGIAHELNNPLQGVLGHLELLRATGAFPKALRRDMQRIYREADRAAKIVRNLLVFAGSRRLVRRGPASTRRCRACLRCARRRFARRTSRSYAATRTCCRASKPTRCCFNRRC